MYPPFMKSALLVTTVATALAATSSFADSLVTIPLASWGADTSNEGRAITPDGKYVVGVSGSANGFFYNVANNTVIQPNGAGAIPNAAVTGIGYRTDPVTLQQQVVLHGASSGFETEWMTTDGGATWGGRRRNTSFTPAVYPTANSLGSSTASANGQYYAVVRATGANGSVYVNQGSGTWVPTMTYSSKGISGGDTASMNGISGTLFGDGTKARAAGYRRNATIGYQNYMLDYSGSATPTANYFAGLAGNNVGQAFSVSGDGSTIYGMSPIVVGGTVNYPYKATFSGTTESSISQLPIYSDSAGSVNLAVPYGCTSDGLFAVGMNYRGIEKAVLWLTKPDNTQCIDLTEYAQNNGILGSWTRLTRGYSVGESFDEFGNEYAVITGIGVNGGVTRGFVMSVMIPEPSTLSLLALGGLAMLAQRRRK